MQRTDHTDALCRLAHKPATPAALSATVARPARRWRIGRGAIAASALAFTTLLASSWSSVLADEPAVEHEASVAAPDRILVAQGPIVVELEIGSVTSVASDSPVRAAVLERMATEIFETADLQPDRWMAVHIADLVLTYAGLPVDLQEQFALAFGTDASTRYEQSVADFLSELLQRVNSERPGLSLGLAGLPAEPTRGNASAEQTNRIFEPVLAQVDAFISLRSFILLDSGQNMPRQVAGSMSEALRLRDGRAIMFRVNGAWRIVLAGTDLDEVPPDVETTGEDGERTGDQFQASDAGGSSPSDPFDSAPTAPSPDVAAVAVETTGVSGPPAMRNVRFHRGGSVGGRTGRSGGVGTGGAGDGRGSPTPETLTDPSGDDLVVMADKPEDPDGKPRKDNNGRRRGGPGGDEEYGGTVDTDGDGMPDEYDECPNDPNKFHPGVCGCGVPDTDSDGDGTPDCLDGCPSDPDKTDPGACGCGVEDVDADGDGTPDCLDGCPFDPDKTDPGACGCGFEDIDTDGDGVEDCNDGCPNDPNKTEEGGCGCGVPDEDTDGDGLLDCNDPCPNDPDPDCGQEESTGWTEFTASSDTRLVYVSATGNDATGRSYQRDEPEIGSDPFRPIGSIRPYRTIEAAYNQLRHGYPDWLLLNRGDTWTTFLPENRWKKGGRSETERMLFGSYGAAPARPTLTKNGAGIVVHGGGGTPPEISHLAFVGIHFYASKKDPDSPDYTGSDGGGGIWWYYQGYNILFEDCHVEFGGLYLQGDNSPYINDVVIRRTIVEKNYRTTQHAQGIYTTKVHGLLVEDCLLDHNGWHESVPGAEATIFNHNMYIQYTCSDVTVRGTISADAASHGLQLRPGGVAENNFFVRNPIAMFTALAPSIVRDNVVVEARDMTPTISRGWGIEVLQCEETLVENNIVAHKGNNVGGRFAFQLGYEPDLDIETYDVTFRNNIVYDWYGPAFVRAPEAQYDVLRFEGNQFQKRMHGGTLIDHAGGLRAGASFHGNIYHSAAPANQWFRINGANHDYDSWVNSSGETGSQSRELPYNDPDRSVARYNAEELDGPESYQAFMLEAKRQSRFNWRPAYTAAAINDYIRAGFE